MYNILVSLTEKIPRVAKKTHPHWNENQQKNNPWIFWRIFRQENKNISTFEKESANKTNHQHKYWNVFKVIIYWATTILPLKNISSPKKTVVQILRKTKIQQVLSISWLTRKPQKSLTLQKKYCRTKKNLKWNRFCVTTKCLNSLLIARRSGILP